MKIEIQWVIPHRLARSHRPGRYSPNNKQVSRPQVEAWIAQAQQMGIRSIICLLNQQQLDYYQPLDLIQYYQQAGWTVGHVPTKDRQHPPLNEVELEQIEQLFQQLPSPLLIHCSAGMDRTGQAVEHLQE